MSIWNITVKDLFLLLRDRRTFAMLLLLPLVFIVIIGLTTGQLLGWKSSNQILKIAILDNTNYSEIGSAEFLATEETPNPTPLSNAERQRERRVAEHLVINTFNSIQRTSGLEIRTVSDWAALQGSAPAGDADDLEAVGRRLLDDGEINALLIFQPDFYRRVYHLEPEDAISTGDDANSDERFARVGIEVVNRDPGSSAASAVSAIIGLNIMDVLNPLIMCRSFNASIVERASPRYREYCGPVNAMASTPPSDPLDPIATEQSSGSGSVYDELVPAYTVMFVFFLVNIMARSFLTERELGTLRRLRIAPISETSILLGKTIPFLIVSLIQTVILFGAGRLLFDMSWGSHPAMLLPIIFSTSAAATGLGLLIATLVKSDSQVSAYATTAVIVLAGISGCFMPRQWLPDLMRQISLATPHAWALIAYDQLLNQAIPDLAQVWRCAGMLLLFAAVFFIAGAWRFKTAK